MKDKDTTVFAELSDKYIGLAVEFVNAVIEDHNETAPESFEDWHRAIKAHEGYIHTLCDMGASEPAFIALEKDLRTVDEGRDAAYRERMQKLIQEDGRGVHISVAVFHDLAAKMADAPTPVHALGALLLKMPYLREVLNAEPVSE